MILFVLDWLPKVGSLLAVLLVLVAYGAAAGSFRWGIQVLLGIDQLANAILAGSSEETISARSYRKAQVPHPHRRWLPAERAAGAGDAATVAGQAPPGSEQEHDPAK